jgi:predicted NUDIX family NTP pyrophosphohydrolase
MEKNLERLSDKDWLRNQLAHNIAPMSGDIALNEGSIRAAVLIALINDPNGVRILLTERAANLRHHPRQIAFPGGKVEPEDDTLEAAALRETTEETGIAGAMIEPLGRLGDYVTITGYRVTPVVGMMPPGLNMQPAQSEVTSIFDIPARLCLDARAYQRRIFQTASGQMRSTFVLPYQNRLIWGATANMLHQLGVTLGMIEKR